MAHVDLGQRGQTDAQGPLSVTRADPTRRRASTSPGMAPASSRGGALTGVARVLSTGGYSGRRLVLR